MFPTFYDMKNQFWAGLWKKKVWGRLSATFEGVFLCFQGQKKIENIIASALKSCIEKRYFFHVFVFFYRLKFECIYMKVGNKHLFPYLWVYCTDVTVLHIDHYKLIVKPFCYGQFSFFKTLFLCHVNRYKQNLFSQSELHTRKSKAYAANCSYSHYTYWLENDSSKMLKHIWCLI